MEYFCDKNISMLLMLFNEIFDKGKAYEAAVKNMQAFNSLVVIPFPISFHFRFSLIQK